MKLFKSLVSIRNRKAVCAAVACASLSLALSGCSGAPSFSSEPFSVGGSGIQGKAFGGETAIVGATAKLYGSGANGYPGTGSSTALATASAVTDANGNFSFDSTSYTCTNGQILYIVISGGNPGGTTSNPALLLAAPVGVCTTANTTNTYPFTVVNEATTVAFAYAFSNFIGVSSGTVNLSAPANNSAYPTGTTSAAAGLYHAYLDYTDLVTQTTGAVNTYTPGTASTTASYAGYVPYQLINSLADVLQGCVNSNGETTSQTIASEGFSLSTPTTSSASVGSSTFATLYSADAIVGTLTGKAGSSGTVGTITLTAGNNITTVAGLVAAINNLNGAITSTFPGASIVASTTNNGTALLLTGPIATSKTITFSVNTLADTNAATISGNTNNCSRLFAWVAPDSGHIPHTTLEAILDVAKNPSANGNITAVFNNYGNTFFTPALSAAPADFSIAVIYRMFTFSGSQTTLYPYPYYVALDQNDNVFVAAPDKSSSATASSVFGFKSDGDLIFNASTPAGAPFDLRTVAPDGLGGVWVTAASNAVYRLSTTDGSLLTTAGNGTSGQCGTGLGANGCYYMTGAVSGSGVDSAGNFFYTAYTSPTAYLYEVPYSSSAYASSVTTLATPSAQTFALYVDPNADIELDLNASTTQLLNTTATVPATYATSYTTPVTFGTSAYGYASDCNGNTYATSVGGSIGKLVPTYTVAPTAGTCITSANYPITAAATATSASYNSGYFSSSRYDQVDGAGNVWVPDNTQARIVQFNTTTGYFTSYQPCFIVTATTVCQTPSSGSTGITGSAVYGVRNVAISSSGDIWVPSSTGDTVIQLIGAAAPTWPLVAAGKPGVMPK